MLKILDAKTAWQHFLGENCCFYWNFKKNHGNINMFCRFHKIFIFKQNLLFELNLTWHCPFTCCLKFKAHYFDLAFNNEKHSRHTSF